MDYTQSIQARLSEVLGGAPEVEAVTPLVGGACQDNLRVDARVDGAPRRVVLRSDAKGSLPGSLGRAEEYAVIRAAVEAGVPTPAVWGLSPGLLREGADAYFMDWASGVAIGAKVTRDPRLADARQRLPDQLARALAAIHQVRPEQVALPLPANPDPVEGALRDLRATLDGLPTRRPAQELALRWLSEHRPEEPEVVLVHGDYRVGNFLVDEQGLVAVLDWEFAHWGSPFEDLAWLCLRDWRFGKLALPVGGISPRRPFYQAYAEASGRAVDPAQVLWWEVCGNLRWAAAAIFQGQRVLAGGEQDLELLAIPWRAGEMEYEALRLIEQGVR
ncbi:MAG: phosphotransferase family protein [Alphaproteobacteria bacterium]|nr:phosphotransferase family protein [Alphaproteobacteria bacterium]